MKAKTKLFFFTLLASFVLFTGCDSDDDYQPSVMQLFPTSIEFNLSSGDPSVHSNYSEIWNIEYDSQNRIASMSYRNNVVDYITTHTFLYEGNDIAEILTRNDNSGYYKAIKYEFKENRIEIDNGTSISIDSKMREDKMVYDNNGNAIKRQEEKYRYDKENGVFRHVNMPAWFLSTHFNFIGMNVYNNCTSETWNGTPYYKYVMEYNTNNYPISITRNSIDIILGGTLMNYYIEYTDLK